MAKRKDRPSWFKMFDHQKALIDSVPDEVAGKAIKEVFRYFAFGEVGEMEPLAFSVFASIKPYIDESYEDFQRIREKNAKNVRKRWEIPNDTNDTSGSHSIPKIPNATNNTEAEAEAEAEAETKADNAIFFYKADSVKKTVMPPSIDEIRQYCKEKQYSFDPVAFESYYRAKGWMLNDTPITEWKAVADFWHHNKGTTYGNHKNKVPYGSGELGKAELEAIRQVLKGD